MKLKRSASAVSALVSATIMTTAAAPETANAFDMKGALPAGSTCHRSLPWEGAIPYDGWPGPESSRPFGTADFCYWRFKHQDAETTADYYSAMIVSEWALSAQSNCKDCTAPFNFSIQANRSAINSVYGASSTYSGTGSCTVIPITIAIGPFQPSINPTICAGGKITRTSVSSTAAAWSGTKASYARTTEVLYGLKVPQGACTRFYLSTTYPLYKTYYDTSFHSTARSGNDNTYIPNSPC